MITIFLFGQLKDIVGNSRLDLDDIADTDSLTKELKQRFPLLENMKFALSVDRKIISGNTSLNPNSEIALLPPFSGG
jgi:sulfur-carrier protein